MGNFGYYIFCIIALVVVFFILKKIAGCLMKTLVLAVLVGVLVALYFLVFK
ncbi:uncharacterized protein BN467_00727 [Prevotella sp. CAG:1124]|jgi:hypothetical protein|nr:uncharacterized protein BN467_00727 [Prevotella sp. CAG:1124]